jgi:hypothetical protein
MLYIGSACALSAKSDSRVLIYYFQNLTGNADYDDLAYTIPLCLYTRFRAEFEKGQLFLAEQSGLEDYYEDNTEDLWNTDYILDVAKKRRITRVLYGFFYLDGAAVVLNSKMYFLDSGLVLDVTEEQEPFYTALADLEGAPVDRVRACVPPAGVEEDEGGRNPLRDSKQIRIRKKAPDIVAASRSLKSVALSAGPVFPTGEFAEIYTRGVSATVDYTVFPKKEISRFGLGFQTGAIRFNRETTEPFLASQTVVVPIGASLKYTVFTQRKKDLLVANLTLGIAYSSLDINGNVINSVDLYSRGGLDLHLLVGREANLVMGVHLITVSFKDSPLNMISGEIGVRVFEF